MDSVISRAAWSFAVLVFAAGLIGVPAAALAQSGSSAPVKTVSDLG